jgi:hypothetical protein
MGPIPAADEADEDVRARRPAAVADGGCPLGIFAPAEEAAAGGAWEEAVEGDALLAGVPAERVSLVSSWFS